MDPTTGQGASQALEDSQTLSLLLKKVLQTEGAGYTVEGNEKEKVDLAIKLYHEVRKPRVREIVERGKKLAGRKANVGVVAEYFMYFFLWMLNKFPWIGELQALPWNVHNRLTNGRQSDSRRREQEALRVVGSG